METLMDETGEGASIQSYADGSHALGSAEPSFGEAESNDFAYQLQNSCLQCNKALSKADIKVIPPRYIQDRDPYVRNGILYKRYMCVPCYNAIKNPTKSRSRIKAGGEETSSKSRKARIIKSFLNGMFFKKQSDSRL